LAVDQKRIGGGADIIPLRNLKNLLLMDFRVKQSGFSFLKVLNSGEKPLISGEPHKQFERSSNGLRIDCSSS
jgi:hypothetical protein